MSLDSELSQFGLDSKKSKAYLACLELGEARVQDIAKRAGISRPTTYDILAKLSEMGLVSFYQKRGVKYFLADSPERFQKILKEKADLFSNLLPELQSRHNKSQVKPIVNYYEGVEGIKEILFDTLTTSQKQLKSILSVVDLFTLLGRDFMENYVNKRVKAGVWLKVIRSEPKEVGETWPTSPKELRELRYSPNHMVFSMTMYFYNNKVALISSKKENFGMIIQSEEYYQNMNHLFDALWEISSPS